MPPKKNGKNGDAVDPPKKVSSPIKTKIENKKLTSKTTKRTVSSHIVVVYGFGNDLPYEAYMYTKGGTDDGYMNSYRKYIDEDDYPVDFLSNAGFFAYFNRRESKEGNAILHNPQGFFRLVMMRSIPGGNPSTKSTRASGLKLLKHFFGDKAYMTYPQDVNTVDSTDDENPVSMDNFLLNHDILALMERALDDDVLNEDFYANYPDLANAFFSGNSIPTEAVSKYRYPADRAITAPNFAFPAEGTNGPSGVHP